MIVLDASVLIAHLDTDDRHHGRAHALLIDAVDDELAASPLTLAETLVGPARAGRLEAAVAAITALGVAEVPLEPGAPVRLAALRFETRLKLPDCCVLLAAEQVAAAVATFDAALGGVARQRGHRVHGAV